MKVSVSNLDLFRRYRDDEEQTLEEFLAELNRERVETRAMMAGKALHAILEKVACGADLSVAEHGGITFRFDLDDELPLCPVREMRGSKVYHVGGESVEVRGRVDAILGYAIEDHKLTGSGFDAIRYADSYQWRLYLDMFGARQFFYNVFVSGTDRHDPGVIVIREFHRFPLYTYPTLLADLERLIADYVEFAKTHLKVAA